MNYNDQPATRGGGTVERPLNEAQHWMVWQRPGGQLPLQKKYGQLDVTLQAGTTVTLNVANRYNTYGFGGSKRVILTTNSWVGGRNLVLPGLYLAVAGVCYLLALIFVLGYDVGLVWKRRPGDLDELSWVRGGDGGVSSADRGRWRDRA